MKRKHHVRGIEIEKEHNNGSRTISTEIFTRSKNQNLEILKQFSNQNTETIHNHSLNPNTETQISFGWFDEWEDMFDEWRIYNVVVRIGFWWVRSEMPLKSAWKERARIRSLLFDAIEESRTLCCLLGLCVAVLLSWERKKNWKRLMKIWGRRREKMMNREKLGIDSSLLHTIDMQSNG